MTGGVKTIIFTTYIRTADRLFKHFSNSDMGRPVFEITGNVASRKKRGEIIKEFKDSKGGILVCSDALSIGVNLQFADTLMNYSLPWEPATFKQRRGRIERMNGETSKRIMHIITDQETETRKKELISSKTWISVKAMQR